MSDNNSALCILSRVLGKVNAPNIKMCLPAVSSRLFRVLFKGTEKANCILQEVANEFCDVTLVELLSKVDKLSHLIMQLVFSQRVLENTAVGTFALDETWSFIRCVEQHGHTDHNHCDHKTAVRLRGSKTNLSVLKFSLLENLR